MGDGTVRKVSAAVPAFDCPACHEIIPLGDEQLSDATSAHMWDIHDVVEIVAYRCSGCETLYAIADDAATCGTTARCGDPS